ncbi:hypothetical protein [Eleftheria terrae]|uniref:hypothetical protein n=1 Tax=Eleftheria terrae TaxID=1597781 RepID=UPI00263BA284|nr:hypothetical protein [Eleftheria terrae]WKB54882.1 hypothetical protein N7L95_11065 [Eleftheria terrae]
MNATLTKRCTVALLSAMTLALIVGLLACGPISETRRGVDALSDLGAARALQVLAALNLFAAGLWGLLSARRMALPWQLLFASLALSGPAAIYDGATSHDSSLLLAHVPGAWACVMLMCAFLAERIDERWQRWPLVLGALLLATASAVHWSVGQVTQGAGDLRGLLLVQLLPLLLIPAGALRLEGHCTSRADWRIVLTLYALALLADACHERLAPWLGPWAGPTLKQALLTAAAAWLAQRAGAWAAGRGASASAVGPSARDASTSWNTCA